MSISKLVFVDVEKVNSRWPKTQHLMQCLFHLVQWSQSMPPSVHEARYELKVGHL